MEIDTQLKTIAVKPDVIYRQEDVLALNITSMRGTGGYIHDYLELTFQSGKPVNIFRIENSLLSKDKEGEALAEFIAEAIGLQLIRDKK